MKEQMKSSMASLLLTVSLVACSGNSNDSGSIRADLRNPSKEAALIELGQLRHLLVIRGSPFAPLSEAFQPGTVPVTDCSSGSVEATEVEAERRLMFYDGFDRTADVTVSRFDRCQADGSLQDHVVEMGEFQGFDPVNDPGDSFDSYAVFGDADGAYRLEVDGTIEDISGRVESRSSDIGVESAWVLSRTVERTSPEPYVLVWEQGAPGDPRWVYHRRLRSGGGQCPYRP